MNLKYEVGQEVAIEVPKTVTETITEIISAEIKSITIGASGAKYLTSKGAFTEEQLDSYAQTAQEEPAFDWDVFKSGKIAVHCDTEEKAKAFCKEVKKRFPHECRNWGRDETNWDNYKEKTLYGINGGFVYGTEFGFGRCAIVDYPFTTEPAQPKEPIKLYCVKDYNGLCHRLCKGEVYEWHDGALYVHGEHQATANKTYEEWAKINSGYAECLIPLVSRPAKVGEWVYVTGLCTEDSLSGGMKVGDISNVVRLNDNFGVYIRAHKKSAFGLTEDGPVTLLRNADPQYLVLDGYAPELEYYNGKVVCVDNGGAQYFEVGKVYCFYNGAIFGAHGFYSSQYETLEKANSRNGVGAKFIEFKGE